jgi:hypothetical protein
MCFISMCIYVTLLLLEQYFNVSEITIVISQTKWCVAPDVHRQMHRIPDTKLAGTMQTSSCSL